MILILKQVVQLLIVDLQEGAIDCEARVSFLVATAAIVFSVLGCLHFELSKYLFNRPWDNAKLFFVSQKAVNVAIEAQTAQAVLVATLIVVPVRPEHRVSLS
jgi:hypothetical protein